MNKNTALGLFLIALILIGFSWYNNRIYKEQSEYKRIQDSIAVERQLEYAKELAEKQVDTLSKALSGNQAIQQPSSNSIFKDFLLDSAYHAKGELLYLENDNIKVGITTKGAQPFTVEVKDYYTYDSLALMLMRENASSFGLELYTDQILKTTDFTFVPLYHDNSTLSLRLLFASGAYIDYTYVLPEESYMVNLNITMEGMSSVIPRNLSQFDLFWNMNLPRLEKGYTNEKNYSTLAYKYPNDDTIETLGLRKDAASQKVRTRISWFGYQQQFFSAILVAENSFTSGDLAFKFFTEDDPSNNLMACSASVQVEKGSESTVNIPLEFYFGPNHYKTLKSYDKGFEKIVPLGGWLIGWINRLFIINVFDFLSKYIKSYGIIILLMTILIKLIISPLTLKSYMSSAKMRVIKPEVDAINAKYPKTEDAAKKQQETMALYKKAGVNMFGGCLPMLLQFPILFAMFRFFPSSFELRQQSFLWATDLSAYDSILTLPFKIPLYGDHVSLFALLMAVSMHFYARMTMDQMNTGGTQMAGMKGMQLWFMPIFLLVLCNNFSSGLSYYYMLSNLFTMLQTWAIRKFFVDEEKIHAQIKAKSAEPVKKSKFQERLEAAQKAQAKAQTQQRQQTKKR